ncbi:MAG TPA: methionyl-tRNA formyltransferase [Actinomycetota bacterium]
MAGSHSLRVAFLGNDEWSVPSLEALAGSAHELTVVVTRGPRPARRGGALRPTPVAAAAARLRVPVAEVETVRSGPGFERLEAPAPDVLVVVAYGELLPPAVLGLPKIAPVNLHFSLLPRLRGASPVQTALLLGLDTTGVTTIWMDEGLDTGPILHRREEPIRPDDDAGSLGSRLARMGGEVLVETVDGLARGTVSPVPQDHSQATFAPKIGSEDRRLDWSKPAPALANLVRALSPDPATVTTFRGEPLKVLRAEAVGGGGEPGVVVNVAKDGFVVGTGEGRFRPLEVAPSGRKRMSAEEFVRGFRPVAGERLG